eukprot:TRINITY_DN13480_c0_g1_i1.p3 TRINITY_DN13480_c0_g1~~TRINITY_DN13480_c0_g1_i1.p3  ORF type:complete len:126 (-),score=5.71 TRINITY_DN13480_c0_g1_i1:1027-1404(-)
MTKPTIPNQKVGLSMRCDKHNIELDAEAPSISAMLPFASVCTGATDTLYFDGQAPSVTTVEVLKPTRPIPSLFCRPMKARNRPMPADAEILTGLGTNFASFALKPKAAMRRKMIPSIITAARALL